MGETWELIRNAEFQALLLTHRVRTYVWIRFHRWFVSHSSLRSTQEPRAHIWSSCKFILKSASLHADVAADVWAQQDVCTHSTFRHGLSCLDLICTYTATLIIDLLIVILCCLSLPFSLPPSLSVFPFSLSPCHFPFLSMWNIYPKIHHHIYDIYMCMCVYIYHYMYMSYVYKIYNVYIIIYHI